MIFLKRKNNLYLKFNEAIIYDLQDSVFYLVNKEYFKGLIEIPLYEVILSDENKNILEKTLSQLLIFDVFLFCSKIDILTNERKKEIQQKTINFLRELLNEINKGD